MSHAKGASSGYPGNNSDHNLDHKPDIMHCVKEVFDKSNNSAHSNQSEQMKSNKTVVAIFQNLIFFSSSESEDILTFARTLT